MVRFLLFVICVVLLLLWVFVYLVAVGVADCYCCVVLFYCVILFVYLFCIYVCLYLFVGMRLLLWFVCCLNVGCLVCFSLFWFSWLFVDCGYVTSGCCVDVLLFYVD